MIMLSIDQMFVDVINDKNFEYVIRKNLTGDYYSDMMSELYLIVIDMDNERLYDLYKKKWLKGFLYNTIRNQMSLKCTNCFYYKLLQKNVKTSELGYMLPADTSEVEDDEELKNVYDNRLEDIKSIVRHIHPKKQVVFDMYYLQNKNYREISEITNIKLKTVALWVSSSIKEVREKYKNKNKDI